MEEAPIVYIDRLYGDPEGVTQPWPRRRRSPDDPGEWSAYCDSGPGRGEEAHFDDVDQAIAWGRERAEIVFVRLGSAMDAHYSAGSRAATWYLDGSGWPFPQWPPVSWPRYEGPPEPGWPEFDVPDDEV